MMNIETKTHAVRISNYSNQVTVCMRCKAMLFWDGECTPHVLSLGDNNILTCLAVGCELVPTEISTCVQ